MPPPSETEAKVIRITREEAMGSHVDDLLKRQMSFRGATGITRDLGKRWYYQSWFLLMIAGAVGAFIAWAIMEPHFDDRQYLQGLVSSVDSNRTLPLRIHSGDRYFEFKPQFRALVRGTVTVNGQDFWLHKDTKALNLDGTKSPITPAELSTGREIGVYAEGLVVGDKSEFFAMYVDPSPPARPEGAAPMSFSQVLAKNQASSLLLFPLVAAFIGLAIGAADGIVCRLPRRALMAGGVGLLVGFIGGFVSSTLASLVYSPLNQLAVQQQGQSFGSLSTFGFFVQVTARILAWGLAGTAMGLGQGIALRSKRLLLYGLLGGVLGGLLGGLLFDPIDLLLLGPDKPSAHWSRLIGFCVIGASVGGMIGFVELMARDAWLRMTQGPLAGKEFLIFKDIMNLGSSPRCEIYLFNDPGVEDVHATIRAIGDECEIENVSTTNPAQINNRPVTRSRLRHGDQIRIGRTEFVFQRRRG